VLFGRFSLTLFSESETALAKNRSASHQSTPKYLLQPQKEAPLMVGTNDRRSEMRRIFTRSSIPVGISNDSGWLEIFSGRPQTPHGKFEIRQLLPAFNKSYVVTLRSLIEIFPGCETGCFNRQLECL
jgi:hypothetical protein